MLSLIVAIVVILRFLCLRKTIQTLFVLLVFPICRGGPFDLGLLEELQENGLTRFGCAARIVIFLLRRAAHQLIWFDSHSSWWAVLATFINLDLAD